MKTDCLFTANKAWLLFFVHITLAGFGMYWCYHVDGRTYGFPEMVKTLWWVEVLLSVLAIAAIVKYANWRKIGFNPLQKSALWWLAIPALTIAISWAELWPRLQTSNEEQFSLFLLIGFTTALVGLSEELVYRGFILRGFLTKYPLWLAMLLSALLFSLLHSINIFANLGVIEMLVQCSVTFTVGLFYVPLALRLNNLWPLILLHWQWDFVIIGADLLDVDLSSTLVLLGSQALFIIPLWFLLLRKPSQEQT